MAAPFPLTPLRAIVLAAFALPLVAAAPSAPRAGLVGAERYAWFTPPDLPAVQAAWVVGAEQEPGLYALRVQLAAGGRIPLHAHPDVRYSTVLSGTLYVGFDDAQSATFAVPAGGVYVAPAHRAHHLWAKDGPVVYQESGVGPTANLPPPAAR